MIPNETWHARNCMNSTTRQGTAPHGTARRCSAELLIALRCATELILGEQPTDATEKEARFQRAKHGVFQAGTV